MRLIIKRLRVVGDRGERRLQVLFDSGASASFVRQDAVAPIARTLKLPSPETYTLAYEAGKLRVKETTVLYVYGNEIRISDNFIVAPRLAHEVIIGTKTLQKWCIKLDLEPERVIIDNGMARLFLA